MMRSYPVPVALRDEVGSDCVRVAPVAIAAGAYSSPEAREWAWRVLDAERDRVEKALVACGCDPDASHFGILDPDSDDLVTAVVSLDRGSGMLRRWNGSGWDEVPAEMHPVGYRFVSLDDDDEMLADVLGSVTAGGVLLRPTTPKAKVSGSVVAAPAPGGFFAVVDEFDTSALLDLLFVSPGPQVRRRTEGQWKVDTTILNRLQGVDPPTVVSVTPEQAKAAIPSIDQYDRDHPPKKPPVTAAVWNEQLHPRNAGKFATGQGPESTTPASSAQANALANYVANGGTPPPGVVVTPVKGAKKGGAGAKKRGGGGAAKKGAAKRGAGTKKAAAVHKPAGGGGAAKAGPGTKNVAAAKATAQAKQASQAVAQKANALKTRQAAVKNQWAVENAKSAKVDGAYDVARAKSDMAESQRRGAVDAHLKSLHDAIAGVTTKTGPLPTDQIVTQQEALAQEIKSEQARRTQYDTAAKYEAQAEKIRRMERRQNAAVARAVQWQALTAGANPPSHSMMPDKLKDYWTRGKGAAKIRWGVGGDFNRCRRALSKYFSPAQIPGACANLHKLATGVWPGKGQVASGYVGAGSMVAMALGPEVAAYLTGQVVDGNPPSEMHVTLAYLGEDCDPLALQVAGQITAALSLEYNLLAATFGGRITFENEPPAQCVSIDAPGLEYLQTDLCDRLSRAGVEVSRDHGFTPHTTLKYGPIAEEEWPQLPVESPLGTIQLCSGSNVLGSWDLLP